MLSPKGKPITDNATRTFVNRCAELSLWAWVCCDQTLSYYPPTLDSGAATGEMPDPLLTEALQARLFDITRSTVPVAMTDQISAIWIADNDGLGEGFVLVSANSGADLTVLRRSLAWIIADLRRSDQYNYAIEDLTEQLGQCYENITLLYGIGKSMSSIDGLHEMAHGICEQMRESQGFGWSAVRFKADANDISGLSDTCIHGGDLPCEEKSFRVETSKLLSSWSDSEWHQILSMNEHPFADLVRSQVILCPIRHDRNVIGMVLAGGKVGEDSEATSGDTQLLDAIAGFLGALHENAARFVEQKNMFIGSLQAVSAALDAKDPYTFGHSERVAMLATRLAQSIGLSADEIERIRISGLVHDVGKIGVPETVLCKTGRLSDDEFEQIKKHPRIGYNILKGIPNMADVLDGVLYHHERWDGRGYPENLAGESIPLYGRILAVADTFDAMSSTRSYRQAMPRQRVLDEILKCAGTQFDPSLTGPFVAMDFTEYDRMVAQHQGASTRPGKERAA